MRRSPPMLEKTAARSRRRAAGFIAYHLEEAGDAAQAASYNMKAAMWHGTRDPAQALDAWKRMRRLLLELPLEGPARYPLVLASGQIVNLAWREGMTAADVEPYYQEALGIATSFGDMRGVTLVTAAYGRALASSGSAIDYVATVTQAMERLDPVRHVGLLVVLSALRLPCTLAGGRPARRASRQRLRIGQCREGRGCGRANLGFRCWPGSGAYAARCWP